MSLARSQQVYRRDHRSCRPSEDSQNLQMMTLDQVAHELSRRLTSLFVPDAGGHRPCHGNDPRFAEDPRCRDLVLFHEYFHGDTGRGLGASHQTGWTALVVRCFEDLARGRVVERRNAMPLLS